MSLPFLQKKMERNVKKVTFKEDVQIYYMHVWKYAYREARKNYWLTFTTDRMRFKRRIEKLEDIMSPILQQKLITIERMK